MFISCGYLASIDLVYNYVHTSRYPNKNWRLLLKVWVKNLYFIPSSYYVHM